MTEEEIYQKLTELFCKTFKREGIVISSDTCRYSRVDISYIYESGL